MICLLFFVGCPSLLNVLLARILLLFYQIKPKQTLQPCRRPKGNKRSRVRHRKIPNISNYRLEMMPILLIIHWQALQTLRYNQNLPKFLLDMRYFCNFSLVSLGIRPRLRRCAERARQGEGRWSRPPKPALERSYLTENSSSANRIFRPRRKEIS